MNVFTDKLFLQNTKTFQFLSDEEEENSKIFLDNEQGLNYDGFNMDNFNFFSRVPSKEIYQSDKYEKKKCSFKNENDNSLILIDDFESFYKIFADIKDVNEMDLDNEECKTPCFDICSEVGKRLTYSNVEEEEVLRIENDNLKEKNGKLIKIKIFEITKTKKSKKNIVKINKNENKVSKKKSKEKRIKSPIRILNETKNKYFPFTKGKGIIFYPKIKKESLTPGIGGNPNNDNWSSHNGSSTNEKEIYPPNENGESKKKNQKKEKKKGNFEINKEQFKEDSPNETIDYTDNICKPFDNFFYKFITKKYFVAENGKKKRVKKKRKFKPDDIRKKIKARFHKTIKNIINENLKKAGSKHFFSFLPQIFISSIAREKNHQVLNLTYKELLQKDFVSQVEEDKYKNKNVDLSKYKNNLRVLEYLDKNPEICQNSGFDIISKMKYSELLEEYFKSDEFDKAIDKLRQENEEEDYINEYINKAKSYVKFFSEVPFKTNVNKNKKNSSEKNSEIEDNKNENEK